MSPLEFVEVKTDLHLNVMLYGAPKTGKTTGACTAPGPILLLNADRPNASRFARVHSDSQIHEVKLHGLQTLVDVTNLLLEKPDDYASIVVDPVGELYANILDGLSGRAVRPAINLRGDAGVHLERFCRAMCDLPLNAVFVAHEYQVEDPDAGIENLPFVTSKSGSPVFGAKLMAMVDVIGYTGVIEKPQDEPPEYVAQLRPSDGRRAGGRFQTLGLVRPVDITEWVKLAQAELAQGKEQQ